MADRREPTNYWDYIRVEDLLALQGGAARNLFAREPVPESDLAVAVAALQRVTAIFGLAAEHFALMETMRTQVYLTFRDKLSPASGFQSAQMRELEILFGLPAEDRIGFGSEGGFK